MGEEKRWGDYIKEVLTQFSTWVITSIFALLFWAGTSILLMQGTVDSHEKRICSVERDHDMIIEMKNDIKWLVNDRKSQK